MQDSARHFEGPILSTHVPDIAPAQVARTPATKRVILAASGEPVSAKIMMGVVI